MMTFSIFTCAGCSAACVTDIARAGKTAVIVGAHSISVTVVQTCRAFVNV